MDRYDQLISQFKDHMNQNSEIECCGIITMDYKYIPCKNISPYPKESFVLDPIALFDYSDNCWGIFHSHTNLHDVLPSEEDKGATMFKQYKFIVGNPNNTFYQYWVDELNYLRFKNFTKESLT
jgi:proteasome lid subunit RPN8/RPN11